MLQVIEQAGEDPAAFRKQIARLTQQALQEANAEHSLNQQQQQQQPEENEQKSLQHHKEQCENEQASVSNDREDTVALVGVLMGSKKGSAEESLLTQDKAGGRAWEETVASPAGITSPEHEATGPAKDADASGLAVEAAKEAGSTGLAAGAAAGSVQPPSPMKRQAPQGPLQGAHAMLGSPGSKKLRWRLYESQQE
jgi:hypothetical protein